MKRIINIVFTFILASFISFNLSAQSHRSNGRHPYYGGGHHTKSHGATIKTEEVVHIEVDIIKTLILRIPMVDIRAQQPPYIGGVNRFIKKDSIY